MRKNDVRLRKERSENKSGELFRENSIPLLKETNYYIKSGFLLDGDAPKQFIKAYFFEENSSIRRLKPKTWPFYLAKTAEKWYPHESVVEYMINKIGEELGIRMNRMKLVRANGEIRFLSQYFIKKDEILVHGAEICGQHLDDMELAREIANNIQNARELFTFEFICEAIKSVFPNAWQQLIMEFVKMLTFDAITGNNDRHFYNWGIIDYKTKNLKKLPQFAPVFDSARGLFWNWSDENILSQTQVKDGKRFARYIENASPRVSINDNCNVNHFELIRHLKYKEDAYKEIINELSSASKENDVLNMLKKEFYPLFIKERQNLITDTLIQRFKKIREV